MAERTYKLRCPKAHAMWVPEGSLERHAPPVCAFEKNGKRCDLPMVDTGVYR